ncbi:MAG: sulfatase-like hydrolase/transferase [Planctomycetes bacterium]|nr:sulfatase-like hydrolase/transferase [Planctomycetota bacterium]
MRSGTSGTSGTRRRALPLAATIGAVALLLAWTQARSQERSPAGGRDAAASAPSSIAPQNVLLITLDTFRADRLAPWGAGGLAPTLDALAAESLVVRDAYSVAPLTFPSHTSMLTGLYPFAHGVRDNDLYRLDRTAPSVAVELRDAGFRTEAIVAASVLRSGTGLDLGFERYSDVEFTRGRNLAIEAERRADAVSDELLARLAVDDARPWFLWAHYFDAHAPYAAPNGPPATASLIEQYDAEVRYLDGQLARVVAALRESGTLARTWIVVVADHGEGLGLQQEMAHAYLCEEGTLRVPLFVRRPDGALRGELTALSSIVDVAPTLLAAAGLSSSLERHGRDLLAAFAAQQAGGDAADAQEQRALWFESWAGWHQFKWARMEGVVAGRFKYVKSLGDELFDLGELPLEARNVAAERGEVVRALKQRMAALQEEPVARLESAAGSLPPEEVARLRELGYLARMVGDDEASAESTLDPRVHYKSCVELQFALESAQRGEFDVAVKVLDGLSRAYPQNPLFREFHGKVLLKANRKEQAAQVFAAALQVDPDLVSSGFYLGTLMREAGRFAEARRLLEHVVALSPVHLEAWLQLRAVHDAEKRYDLVLLDTAEIVKLAAALPGQDGEALLKNSLEQWLPNVLAKRLQGDPRLPELKAQARAKLGEGDAPALAKARALLDQ